MRRVWLGLVGAAVVLGGTGFAQEPIRAGQWEITSQMSMAGLPMRMPPVTITQCLSAEDAADPMIALPAPADEPDACEIEEYAFEGDTVTWRVACEGDEPMEGTGELTVTADAYDGWIELTTEDDEEMRITYRGKRLGDCAN